MHSIEALGAGLRNIGESKKLLILPYFQYFCNVLTVLLSTSTEH